uniref:FBA_2 domain-containing protein n=1 Tax=Caenorhabditis tropicalis TaxID=1561998 RepID=A0A1I7UTA9_9PELO
MSFQLQHLPFLALEEVIKCMDTFSILFLMKTSNKTKDYVIGITKRLKTNLDILLNEEEAYCTPCQDFDGELRPSEVLKRSNKEYSIEKFISVIESFYNVFCIKTISIHIETESSADPYLLWKYVKNQNLKIQTLVWKTEDLSPERTKEVIEASSDLEILKIHFKKQAPVLTAVDLYPLIGCGSLTLHNINFTSQDLNLFLKHWFAKSKTLSAICIVAVEPFDRLTAIEGIDVVDGQAEPHPDYENFEIMFWKTKFLVEQV